MDGLPTVQRVPLGRPRSAGDRRAGGGQEDRRGAGFEMAQIDNESLVVGGNGCSVQRDAQSIDHAIGESHHAGLRG